ncbi:asparagine synthase (glutamine-hydrolyzing) [Ferruginibacter lapsinanis]|uniref:asparagine synthase (glutamine-hydrolyzing) n=1 Tax=Ferruginibacter lapsinanis TaxID=563172 RepID=UPI001E38F1DF|nr:asparagine synthase (glutamine-hydrolyzing) [Ferruginibacter lapsinanis]UEG50946.1 asparagine synthase (glutamine-hydrolyzing) [Ferruginibacter lapsinanis]
MPGFFLDIYIMCGIAGIISPNSLVVNEGLLHSMANTIAHRGPDSEGYWINDDGNMGFAHRRLSIIDLSNAGAQPMHYLNRYTIVYNGEIYNYIEVREELRKHGYSFASQSDTEVILAAYDYWKSDCLQHFDGMFAFAIWDDKKKKLFAARDRFGEKPFYYYEENGHLAFASEMKALWAIGIEKKPDPKMLLNYLTLGHVQNVKEKKETFFENIYSLPPAHYLSFSPFTGQLSILSYWDLNKEKEINYTEKEAIVKFTELFNHSINRRLRSDVPVGTSLSGGLDSSSIVAVVSKLKANGDRLKTFSAVFPGFEKDESKYIAEIATNFNVDNFQITPSADELIKNFETLCYHQEEPFPSSSIFLQYKVFELAAKHKTKVLLDGQGADETLGGYHKYIHWHLQQLIGRGKFKQLKNDIRIFKENNFSFDWGIRNYIASYFPSHIAIFLEKNEYRKMIYNRNINREFSASLAGRGLEGIYKPIVTKLNDLLYYNTTQMGLEELLRYADRNSMAHGTEVRLPFLSHELVEFIFSLPSNFKIHDGWTKWLLRKAMEKNLPDAIVWRKDKVGYEPPQQEWMHNKKLMEYIHEAKKKLVAEKILSPSVLNNKIVPMAAHDADNFDWRYLCAAQLL